MAGLEKFENVIRAPNLVELKPWQSLHKTITAPMISALGAKDIPDSQMAIGFAHIETPLTIIDASHTHPFDQYIFIIGTSDNFVDFDAEVELELDGVVHHIDYPFYAFIPAGTPHCPLSVKRAGKPVIFVDARLSEAASVRG